MHDSIQIEETAANWLARRDGEGWCADAQLVLAQWLDASTANRVAYIRLDAAWQKARRLKALAVGVMKRWSNDPGGGLTGPTSLNDQTPQ
jgi:transmembrane sensor